MNGRRAAAVRHEVTGTLETITALRPGGWGSSVYADLVVARDGLGRLMIPGTSLAGALRSWLGSVTGPAGDPLYDRAGLAAVFGDLEYRSQRGTICRIMVDDAVAAGDVSVLVRDGVGIDRITGSAAAGILYQQEVVPPGTMFAVRITAALSPMDTERAGRALDLLVQALAAGRVDIGAARTRGLGQVRLTGITRTRVDLADRAQVLGWLCGRPVPGPVADPVRLPGDGRLGIEVSWTAVTPVMVRASTVNEAEPARDRAVDTVPLRSGGTGADGSATLLLPGSSVKGVLRSHAERIVRTVTASGGVPDDWLDQVNDPGLGPVTALFGTAGDHRAGDGAAIQDGDAARDGGAIGDGGATRRGRRGALSVHDCLGTTAAERVVTHVAVDRWTGGAAENLLFSVQEPASADWQPMRMSLDAGRAGGPGDQDGGQALALLLLVLRDLADGWLALGFGGTRGRGSVRVSRVAFTGEGLAGVWAGLPGRTLAEVIDDPPGEVRRAFAAWQEGASA